MLTLKRHLEIRTQVDGALKTNKLSAAIYRFDTLAQGPKSEHLNISNIEQCAQFIVS